MTQRLNRMNRRSENRMDIPSKSKRCREQDKDQSGNSSLCNENAFYEYSVFLHEIDQKMKLFESYPIETIDKLGLLEIQSTCQDLQNSAFVFESCQQSHHLSTASLALEVKKEEEQASDKFNLLECSASEDPIFSKSGDWNNEEGGKMSKLEIKRKHRLACGRKVIDDEMERKLLDWLSETKTVGCIINSSVIREKARQFCSNQRFKGSKGWLSRFIARYSLQSLYKFT